MRNFVITLEVLRLLFNPFGHKVVDAARDITRRILLQTCHDQILFVHDAAIIQPLFAVEDFHQRRFARAVTSYQTDTFVILDMQFGIIEEGRIAKRQPCAMHTN